MKLPALAIRYRAIVIMAVCALTAWGIVAFRTMPQREDPEFRIRTCVIITSWPGATAEKIEQLVTDPIETAVEEIEEVDEVLSESKAGLSVVYVNLFEWWSEVDQAWDKVRARVDRVVPNLPDGCKTPIVNDDFGDVGVVLIALYQEPSAGRSPEHDYTPRELEIMAERLKDELKLIDAVSRVDLFGVQEEVIYLEVDPGKWSQLELTIADLAHVLQQRNIVEPGGTLDAEYSRFGIKPSGEFSDVRQIERVILGLGEGRAPVYLTDLGINVRRAFREPPPRIARYGDVEGSAECIVLSVQMKSGTKITDLGAEIEATLDEFHASSLPVADVATTIVHHQPVIVEDAIRNFTGNLTQAIVIVVAVAFFLVGLRIALVMAAAIPIVIFSSIGLSRLFGIELEQMSIASLIIALGMLVDNAIEVCDNTHRFLEEGKPRFLAASQGAGQIGYPILIATLTTVFAFLPMLVAFRGYTVEYIFSLPVVVSLTLLISWGLAMTLTTIMAYWVMRPRLAAAPLVLIARKLAPLFCRKGEAAGDRRSFKDRYEAACRFCLRHKFLTVVVAVVVLIGAWQLPVGSQFFPPGDRPQFVVDVWLPEGSPIKLTNQVCGQVEELIRDFSPYTKRGRPAQRLANMMSYVGEGGPRFFLSLNPQPEASNYAQIVVNTTSTKAVAEYIEWLRRETLTWVPGARIVARKLDMGPGVENPIAIQLFGEKSGDLATMQAYADELEKLVRDADGTWNVHTSWGEPGYQFDIKIVEDKANAAWVSNASIARTLNAHFSGHYLTTYREGDHSVPVYLYLRPPPELLAAVESPPSGLVETPQQMYVEGVFGKVPLDAIATVKPVWQPAKIGRKDLRRMIEIGARAKEGLLPSEVLAKAILPKVRDFEKTLPSGYRVEIGGEQEDIDKTQGQFLTSFGITFVLIIFCLVIQYNSFVKPLIILLTLPLATIGAMLGLFVLGKPMGFMAMLGILSLAGIFLNVAIVLIEFVAMLIREKLEKGEGVAGEGERSYSGLTREAFRDCLVEAGKMRIMPITLTTLTTVGGLLPLALAGGPLFEPMAAVIIFGLLVATALALLVLPAIIAIFVEKFGLGLVKMERKAEAETK